MYRPGQKVHYKFWVRHAQYDMQAGADFAHQPFSVEVHNPRGEKLLDKEMTSDEFGGIEGQLDLPADATLGVYQLLVAGHGGGTFRVEEYKKPEFEVTVEAPAEPVQLGDKISATVKAKYYFGSPVTQAKVKYKVTRTSHTGAGIRGACGTGSTGRAIGGSPTIIFGIRAGGLGLPAAEAVWWPHYGAAAARGGRQQEVEIGPDGTVKVEIDTATAQAVHRRQKITGTDHRRGG